jgi:flagellar motor switch protein FliN/FliY
LSNEVMSPEEIEKLLNGTGGDDAAAEDTSSAPAAGDETLAVDDYLTKNEQDILGEVGNICMGTSATTMSTLLTKKVVITTPSISIHTVDSLSEEYPAPIVVADVSYIKGLTGDNLLILKEYDVALITAVLLGEDPNEIDPNNVELNEIHLSAIGEVMNQMIGSSATSLADLLNREVDISTPIIKKLNIQDDRISDNFEIEDDMLVKINFVMEIEGLLVSEIMQLLPYNFAKTMAKTVMDEIGGGAEEPAPAPQPAAAAAPAPAPAAAPAPAPAPQPQAPPPTYAPQPAYQQAPMMESHNVIREQQDVNVQNAQFPSFSNAYDARGASVDNIEMLLDVPMQVTVELGKTKKQIKEILHFNTGSVIVLDRVAGEPVDILVNGKKIGKGEVVVIDEDYGVRITEINMPPTSELIE